MAPVIYVCHLPGAKYGKIQFDMRNNIFTFIFNVSFLNLFCQYANNFKFLFYDYYRGCMSHLNTSKWHSKRPLNSKYSIMYKTIELSRMAITQFTCGYICILFRSGQNNT